MYFQINPLIASTSTNKAYLLIKWYLQINPHTVSTNKNSALINTSTNKAYNLKVDLSINPLTASTNRSPIGLTVSIN